MSKVHRWVVSKSTDPVRGVFLDTPAGFEINADDISQRACEYVNALPVYEIYKAGEELHWVGGLDLLASHGLDVAIVSHWNNTEGGTFDTRYCFMGQPRFDLLERLLPESTVVLGIDEYTACVLDLGGNECRVMGAGQVTIRREGQETKFETGASFDLDLLRVSAAAHAERAEAPAGADAATEVVVSSREALLGELAKVGETSEAAAGDHSDLVDVATQIHDLAVALDEAREAGVEGTLISQGRAGLIQLVVDWTNQLASSSGERVGDIAPFVEKLISLRSQLRDAQQWSLADEIREGLSSLGIILEDDPGGTRWR
jgi:hypothetical protein